MSCVIGFVSAFVMGGNGTGRGRVREGRVIVKRVVTRPAAT